jgi:hypothetical protein
VEDDPPAGAAAGIKNEGGCHTFRVTGIMSYFKNGGKLEVAQMAAHESARTTGLHEQRRHEKSGSDSWPYEVNISRP